MSKADSQDGKSDLTLRLNDTEQEQVVVTQYGLRYPDGSIDWDNTKTSYGVRAVKSLVEGTWVGQLKEEIARRAKEASVDPDEYLGDHSFVKRTVILAVTAPEVVGKI